MFSIIEKLEAADGVMDVKPVAELLGVTGKTIYDLVKKGRIPCFHVGSAVKFDPLTLAHWVSKQSPMFAQAKKQAKVF